MLIVELEHVFLFELDLDSSRNQMLFLIHDVSNNEPRDMALLTECETFRCSGTINIAPQWGACAIERVV